MLLWAACLDEIYIASRRSFPCSREMNSPLIERNGSRCRVHNAIVFRVAAQNRRERGRGGERGTVKFQFTPTVIKNVYRPDVLIVIALDLANMGVCRRQALKAIHPFFYEWQGWGLLTLLSILVGLMVFFYVYVYVCKSAFGDRLVRVALPQKCILSRSIKTELTDCRLMRFVRLVIPCSLPWSRLKSYCSYCRCCEFHSCACNISQCGNGGS